MPLSLNEIKDRALRFSREWADAHREDADAKSFWDAFFDIFGVPRRRVATFEQRVRKLGGRDGYIDLLWKGMLLIEHKSRGSDLDRAHAQARDYFHGLTDAELPKYLLVSDFARFRLYDLDGGEPPVEFLLADLHREVQRFGFIAGYQPRRYREEDPVNVEAAERMGKLHDALQANGYEGHQLEVLLVRLLFCLFADDTGIFPRQAFHELITQRTNADGTGLGPWLTELFQTLNTPPERRQRMLDAQLAEFPYVNGRLFAEMLPVAAFNATMRQLLIDAAALDWGRISPAIFGSMFQSVMDKKARRNLGAHYTSEQNILKLIGPLFLDALTAELERIGNHTAKLHAFHGKLAGLRFLDPACGCGNFLVIAYRELRRLELAVLKRLYAVQGSVFTRIGELVRIDVDQFYGIEIEEFPAQIAQVALWLMDHQMNLEVAAEFGEYFVRLPLVKSATIVHGNALRIDWNTVVPREQLSFILGNPPFIGKKEQSYEQKQDVLRIFSGEKGAGNLDYVCCWYALCASFIRDSEIECGLVSTNSISQGEQVGALWRNLFAAGIVINFAHRSFKWSSEAKDKAAVHCVIIGFSLSSRRDKVLFEYASPVSLPQLLKVEKINPYLVAADNILLEKRNSPLSDSIPRMNYGSMPIDDNNLILSDSEYAALVTLDDPCVKWVRKYSGGDELINGRKRWCLWLVDVPPEQIRRSPIAMERVARCKQFRLSSGRQATQALAATPGVFGENRQPTSDYLAVPKVSSEGRLYLPIAIMKPEVIASGSLLIIQDANLFAFGIMQSSQHMAWLRAVSGRMKSDYQYSAGIVYNNYPWPEPLDDKARAAIEAAAQAVLDVRAAFPDSTLADLYDPLTMPPDLVKAHQKLDRAVDTAYLAAEKAAGRKTPRLTTDAERVAFLFERYQALSSPITVSSADGRTTKKPRTRRGSDSIKVPRAT